VEARVTEPARKPDAVTVALVVLLLIGAAIMGWHEVEESRRLPDDSPAPDFTVERLEGAPVTLSALRGEVVLLDFWATWCPPCREEIPGYIELTKKYGKDGLVIIGISLDQAGPGVVRPFVAKSGINYPIVMGDDTTVAAFGGVEGIPTTFLIDREGLIRDKKVGMMATAEYEKKILAILK
jgi:peroxiredoxin